MPQDFSLEKVLNPWLLDLDSYKAGASLEAVIEEHGLKEEEILKFGSNESTIGASPKAIAAAQEACTKSHFYIEPRALWFTKYLEHHYAKSIDMKDLGIVVGNGMDYILDLLGKLFLDTDSSIVISSPTFVYYKLVAEWAGSEVIDIARDDKYNIDPVKIINSVKDNTKIVFLCSPNNPTGNLMSIKDIEYIAQNVNCLVFVDHAYIQFTDPEHDAKNIISKYPNMIIGYTFSKAYALAGYRVGYGLMHRNIYDKYMQVIAPFANTRGSLAAAKAAIEDTEHMQKIIDNNNQGKEYLYKELPKLGFEFFPTESNCILMKHPKFTCEYISSELIKKGIIIRPMSAVCPNSIRVTIGLPKENERFIKALGEIVL